MGICLAIVSGKGGTGKSTVSCGLALSLSEKQKSVALVDLDSGLRCLDMFWGIEEKVVFDLSDALDSGEYSNAYYYPEKYENICVIPAPRDNKQLDKTAFDGFLKNLMQSFDFVILDLPAGLDFSPVSDIPDIDYICVSNPDPISVRDASAVLGELSESGVTPRMIINKFDPILIKNGTYKNLDDIIDLSGIRLLGIVPNSRELMLFSVTHKLRKHGNSKKALSRIAGRICGEKVLLPNPKKI